MLEWALGFSFLFLVAALPYGLGLVMRRFSLLLMTGESLWMEGAVLMIMGILVLGVPYVIGSIVLRLLFYSGG